MGGPIYGETNNLVDELYEVICSEGIILDKIAPMKKKEK